jgi:hypothetical protein
MLAEFVVVRPRPGGVCVPAGSFVTYTLCKGYRGPVHARQSHTAARLDSSKGLMHCSLSHMRTSLADNCVSVRAP